MSNKEGKSINKEMTIHKGKYEMFKVGDELVYSDSRDKIKKYATENGYEKISYRMSSDNKVKLDEMAKEI